MDTFRGGFHPFINPMLPGVQLLSGTESVLYTKAFRVYMHFMVYRQGSLCSDFVKNRMRADKPLTSRSGIKSIQIAKLQPQMRAGRSMEIG